MEILVVISRDFKVLQRKSRNKSPWWVQGHNENLNAEYKSTMANKL